MSLVVTDSKYYTAIAEAIREKSDSTEALMPVQMPEAIKAFNVSVLPDGFVPLEYIVSTGSQYIDADFKPDQDTRVVLDFRNSGDYSGMTTGLCPLFGARNATSSAVFAMWIGETSYPHYGNVAYNKNGSFTTDLNTRLTYDFNKNVATIGSDSVTCADATFTTSHNLYLLTVNNYGSAESRRASGKTYSCKAYHNGVIIRDYVPCMSSQGIAGLYDLISGTFVSSGGIEDFIAGPVKRELPKGYTRLTYIESSGEQYFNLDFLPNQDTRVVLDVELPAQSSYPMALFGGRNADTSSSDSFILWLINSTNFRSDFDTGTLNIGVTPVGRFIIDKNKNVITINGTAYTNTAATFQSNYSLALFTVIDPGGPDTRMAAGKVYSCQSYINGILMRDLVPCIDPSGAYGLFDLVNAKFYGNAGSGSFTGA